MLTENQELFSLILVTHNVVNALLQLLIIFLFETVINVKYKQMAFETTNVKQVVVHFTTKYTVARCLLYSSGLKCVSGKDMKLVTFASTENKFRLTSCTNKWTSPILNVLTTSKS